MKRLATSLIALCAAVGLAHAASTLGANPSATQSLRGAPVTLALGDVYQMTDNVPGDGYGVDFPAPYCALSYALGVHPISRVRGMGIDNQSDPTLDASPSLEDFTAVVGQVQTGELVDISVKGKNVGDSPEGVKVYIDWNQDGIFDDPTEGYLIGYLIYSTGADGSQVTASIRVSSSARTGETRMRVVKAFDLMANPWSCNEGNAIWGQAEDYTLYVGGMESEAIFCGSFEEGEDGSCGTPSPADIVYSGPRNVVIPPTEAGLGINFVTGEMSSEGVSGFDLAIAKADPYLWGPVMFFSWGGETTLALRRQR